MSTIWTIGHSTHSLAEFIDLLRGVGIGQVADVRTVPRSRHVPQFNREVLEADLPRQGIGYIHMQDLGGWRKPLKDSANTGWHHAGFRGYADYMQSPEFRDAADRLMKLAGATPTAVMCAEALPWRCHRSLISDYLATRGIEVLHIFPDGKVKPHAMTPFARVEEGRVTYPPAQDKLL